MTEDRPKGRAQWMVILVIALGLLLSAAWLVRIRSAASQAICQTEFSDGTKLDVLGVSCGERIVDFGNGGGFSRWLRGTSFVRWMGLSGRFGSSGSSTYSLGYFQVERFEEGGRVFKCRGWDQRSDRALLLEIRVRDSGGAPKLMPGYFTGDDAVFDDERLGSNGIYRPFTMPDENPEAWGMALTKAGLPLLVQHRDPQAGWIHLTGPYLFNENEKDRYMVVLPAWQRDLPSLDFRAIQPDGSMVRFSVPNPDLKKAEARPAAVPLPAVYKAADFTFTLQRLGRDFAAGRHPFTWFETKLEAEGETIGADGLWPLQLSVAGSSADDEWGNKAALTSDTVGGKKSGVGVRLPGAARHLSLSFLVDRTASYPRMQTAGDLVMEGVVAADGKTVDFTLLPDAAKFGITAAPAGDVKGVQNFSRGDPRKDWLSVWSVIEIKAGQAERDSLTRDLGDVQGWQYLFFPGDEFESAGQPTGYGASGTTAPTLKITTNRAWNAPPEMLRAGARFRVGIFPPLPSETVKFEIEAPALAK